MMRNYTTLLEEALEAWDYTRQGVISELRNIPEKDLGFRPAEQARSVGELVRHIVESGLLMSGELSRPDGDFQRKSYVAFFREHAPDIGRLRTKGQLLGALRKTHRDGEAALRRAGELHMLQFIRRFDGKMGTRFAWMQHGISHEEYHRGQLALYTRLLGRVPALTQLILSS
jgi:uncharacterized damage-inducible protein DinB